MEQEEMRPTEVAPEGESVLCEEKVSPLTDENESSAVTNEPTPIEEAVEEDALPEPDITHRLAEEFILLREEFPSIERPAQLPDAVLDMAADKSISLLDAYLRFCHEERKRIQREEECRRQAAARSAGSLQQGTVDTHPEQDAFLRAFRTALR